MTKLSAQDQEKRTKLLETVDATRRTYNATWREHPTAKGFPLVDKALDKLHEAERELHEFDKRTAERAPPRVHEPA
jgi:hypothetical protein